MERAISVRVENQSWKMLGFQGDEMDHLDLLKTLEPTDEFGVITKDGKFGGVVSRSEHFIYENADQIQEIMGRIMRRDDYREGLWFWRVNSGWTTVNGRKLGE